MSQGSDVTSLPLLGEEMLEDELPVKQEKRSRKGLIITLIIIAIIVVLVGFFLFRRANRPHVTFNQAQAITGNLAVQVSATGPVAANNEYDLNIPNADQLQQIEVQVGEHVNAG
jgi:multidrug efflux pump subunit AcrA (membrane-fusion protein)